LLVKKALSHAKLLRRWRGRILDRRRRRRAEEEARFWIRGAVHESPGEMKGLLLALDRRRGRRAEEEAYGSEALPASAPRTAGLGGTPERWIGGAATTAARMGEATPAARQLRWGRQMWEAAVVSRGWRGLSWSWGRGRGQFTVREREGRVVREGEGEADPEKTRTKCSLSLIFLGVEIHTHIIFSFSHFFLYTHFFLSFSLFSLLPLNSKTALYLPTPCLDFARPRARM
jgi:hypothetical protein